MNNNIIEPCSSVRAIAEVAKKRINSNYLAEIKAKSLIDDKILKLTRKIILSSIKKNYFPYIDNEDLFNKIYNYTISGNNLLNPIGSLIDNNYYENLCKENQQRYILKLSHIYILIKETYLKVRSYVNNENVNYN